MNHPESGAGAPLLRWRAPLIFLVLVFTAVPSSIHRPALSEGFSGALSLQVNARDVAFNIAGYLPVGLALADLPVPAGVAAAILLSSAAETAQLVTNNRFPSPVDVIANALGALMGLLIGRRRRVTEIALTRARGRLAAFGAAFLLVTTATATWMSSGKHVVSGPGDSSRPATPSTPAPTEPTEEGLVAHWTFDDVQGDVLAGRASNRLSGTLVNGGSLVPGVQGRALMLDGRRQYVDVGSAEALGLRTSMSVSAWVRASSFPGDDAVILSNRSAGGFQLDITPDVGFRTVKFLVTDADGYPVMRYGRTILEPGTWYHVAGVFDASKRTLEVYVNGRSDNGCLVGIVGNAQEPSRSRAHIGRHPHLDGYEYAGAIDDLRVYSRALSAAEIEWLGRAPAEGVAASAGAPSVQAEVSCRLLAHYLDWTTLAATGLFGVLLAVGLVGIRQRKEVWIAAVLLAAAGGLAISHASRAALPPYDEWIVPMLAIAGSASVLLAVLARADEEDA